MLLLIILLLLAAVVQQSFGTDEKTILSEITEEKKKDIVDTFNTLRRSVNPTASNMLKMSWSEEASETAKKWAGNCQLRQSPVEERTINGSVCGESISQAAIPKSWEEIIAKWHSTVSHFKYGIGATDPKKNIYTYTQIVWYRSHQIGCAVAYCAQSTFPFVYICHYCPGGNIMGESKTPYKEGPPCGDCLNDCEDKLCNHVFKEKFHQQVINFPENPACH
ncbi:cysteine-rich venom protein 2-like [Hemicordylus capensis]|uniref:cysteine-rich venom protein 2-like n=1 Tax=Hemicordylus capensis TaxID=884348 RepID=UPI0023043632|nr:cysteine-rich venom protein 2-like [Hemicordylus capensis]